MAIASFDKVWVKICFVLLTTAEFLPPLSAQTLESNPEFDIGDKWTYQFQNTGDRKEPYLYTEQAYKSEAGNALLSVEFQNPESSRKQAIHRYYYKRADVKEKYEFNPAKPRIPGRRYWNAQPLDDMIQLPLSVGKKYSVKYDRPDGYGYAKYDVEVEAFEKLPTQAGEFEAFRIKLSGWWTNTREGNYSGRCEGTIYFAPAAKRSVKTNFFDRTASGSVFNSEKLELVKWEPKASLPEGLVAGNAKPAAPASSVQ